MDNFWAIILSAGTSSRMKTQKMLLPYNGKTIVETVVDNAYHAVGPNIVVVLGSHPEEIRNQIGNRELKYTINKNYPDGMLSSVICGFRALPADTSAILLYLGDQPHIPACVGKKLIHAKAESNKGIIIPVFNGKRGHPVLIDIKYKHEIENLDLKYGLRYLMKNNPEDILEMECDEPGILRDIDTPDDYWFEINRQLK